MNCYLCCFLVLILKLVSATNSSSNNDILVEISSGIVRGTSKETWTNNRYFAFYGIPYAEPPLGNLRFKAPVDVKPWKGIKNATKDGHSCPQSQRQFVGVPTSEDCLYLNVYTKKLQDSQPVIVWIHPGAFIGLTGSSSWYGPDYLLDHDVVFISFNYRLNALGFLSTGDESAVGNYGMKDQVAVLKWVQKNIDKFGGDPKKVTLAGDSAGSAAVFLHMLSPMSQGLFHRAIAMSGGIVGNIRWPKSNEQLHGAEKLSEIFKCPTNSTSDMIECLKNVSAEKIVSKFDSMQEIGERNIFKFGPVIEPDLGKTEENFLLGDPYALIKNNTLKSVPVITGFTEYELFRRGMAIAKNRTILLNLNSNFNKIAPIMLEYDFRNSSDIENITNTLKKYYFGNDNITEHSAESLGQMFSDFRINYGEYATAKLLNLYGDKPVFFYKFSYRGSFANEYDPVNNKTVGPGHMSDVQYVLFNSKLFPKFNESDPEALIVKRMTSMWFNFASIGVPITSESPVQWRPMTEGKYEYLEINRTLKMENGIPFPERMKVWETLFPI